MNITPSSITDTLYYPVDTTRIEEDEKCKASLGAVREATEKEMPAEGQDLQRCVALTRIYGTLSVFESSRNETKRVQVKDVAQETSPPRMLALRDHLCGVKVDNVNRTAILDEISKL